MSNEQMRAEFEVWAREACCMPKGAAINWDADWVKAACEGWQAARRATSGAASGEVVATLERIAAQMRQGGASLPAPANKGTSESALATGLSIGLLLVQTEIDKLEFVVSAEQPAPPVPRMDAELMASAGKMSNVLFDMAQKTGHTLTSDDTARFDKLRKQWDSVASRGGAQGRITDECSLCNGTGALDSAGSICPHCDGKRTETFLTTQSASTAPGRADTERGVKYGCHCDLDQDMEPDDCVIGKPNQTDCAYARKHSAKEQCVYWQPIAALSKEKP